MELDEMIPSPSNASCASDGGESKLFNANSANNVMKDNLEVFPS